MRRHVVVDGSNIATEGRTMPSLQQLNDAVLAFMQEFPDDVITVVVDATFGHRIDPKEVTEFDSAVENNELVSPPAGAVGRGDAFVLTIANKVNATILSNDSYQEFHGDYPWLFEEGRLLGGKPVPNVGWVFVPRTPVRGPLSRRAVREAKKARGRTPRPSKLASEPLPVPKTPPPARRREEVAAPAPTGEPLKPAAVPAPASPKHAPINELLVFLDFVEKHPVGSVVTGTIESFSSHGAYAMVGAARCYVPMRLMGNPPPRSAREIVKLGEERSLVVVSFNAGRRGIDAAIEGFEPPDVVRVPTPTKARKRAKKAAPIEVVPEVPPAAPVKRARKKAVAVEPVPVAAPIAPAEPVPAKRARKKAAAAKAVPVVEPAPVRAAKPARAKKAAKKAAATEPVVPEAPARPARKARAKKASA